MQLTVSFHVEDLFHKKKRYKTFCQSVTLTAEERENLRLRCFFFTDRQMARKQACFHVSFSSATSVQKCWIFLSLVYISRSLLHSTLTSFIF